MRHLRACSALTAIWLSACSSSEIIGRSYSTGGGAAAGNESSAAGAGGTSTSGGGATSSAGSGTVPDVPTTHYDEPLRGQFHYSPSAMWMDTIDGLWHWNGVYHLSYEAVPYAFEQARDAHWGHATSPDLLHWTEQPLMLIPGQNAPGDPWAGSVVVDTENTSGLQTGSSPVFVAIYTATGIGTCMATSNDLGVSWQAYDDNPLAIGTADHTIDRDPLVLWHTPSAQWVAVYWQNGITFYTSPDLRTWTEASNIAWGTLVPDLYELPVDSDPDQTRWVLQDASGEYFVGEFDGHSFVPAAGGPYRMDLGPHFYAARTSYRRTFPDERAVQIGWLRPGDAVTAPWRGSATFPVELGLKTYDDGVRLTRTPIAEIVDLYENEQHFPARTLTADDNLLFGIESKRFDFEFLLDAASAASSEVTLRIAERAIVYDGAAQTLLGQPLGGQDETIAVRVLADHGQLEVFAAGGRFAYSESLAFDPADRTLSFTSTGNVNLVSADFRQLERIWPGSAADSAAVIDDADPGVVYEGDWRAVDGDTTYLGDTCHVAQSEGAALEITFTGTRVAWYGLKNTDLGQANVYVDGVLLGEAIECYSALRAPALLFSATGLGETFHTLRIEATGQKHPDSTGVALVHDYIVTAVDH